MTVPPCAWPEPCVCFGPFRLYPQQRVLLEHDRPLRLGSRAFDILVTLVERAGETVGKEALMARVWPDTVVEEANLRVHVAALRKALRAAPHCIDSVAGRGYSFVATVRRQAAPVIPPCPPPPATALVGQDEAIDTLTLRLQERRLVTLAGTGGVGKTVVALTVAARLAGRLPTCRADLSAAADGAALPAVLAAALGLAPGPDPLNDILVLLRERELLLVMDGCEHVIDAAANLCEQLLHHAPGLRILATSREALRAADEWVQRLAPLAFPPADASDILAWPAPALFVRRAAQAGATVTAADLPAVADICRRLDGVPLALELAAARTDLFHVRELAARLDAPLQLLYGGRRTAPARHRSWRACLDWSYATLAPLERIVLGRLAVLGGEFTLATAAAVAAGPDIRPAQVEDAVATLNERSLLATRQTPAGVRCRLLAGTRAYALALALPGAPVAAEAPAPGRHPAATA